MGTDLIGCCPLLSRDKWKPDSQSGNIKANHTRVNNNKTTVRFERKGEIPTGW
jgi:hypothetical protein